MVGFNRPEPERRWCISVGFCWDEGKRFGKVICWIHTLATSTEDACLQATQLFEPYARRHGLSVVKFTSATCNNGAPRERYRNYVIVDEELAKFEAMSLDECSLELIGKPYKEPQS